MSVDAENLFRDVDIPAWFLRLWHGLLKLYPHKRIIPDVTGYWLGLDAFGPDSIRRAMRRAYQDNPNDFPRMDFIRAHLPRRQQGDRDHPDPMAGKTPEQIEGHMRLNRDFLQQLRHSMNIKNIQSTLDWIEMVGKPGLRALGIPPDKPLDDVPF